MERDNFDHNKLQIKFWGVRGSIATPEADKLGYGGNTACVEVRCGDNVLIFDAGSGIRALGNYLSEQTEDRQYRIFLSHTHIDHINGFPFFKPAYSPDNIIEIYAGHLPPPPRGIESVFRKIMENPLFPVTIDVLKSDLRFYDFEVGGSIVLAPELYIRTAPLNHPDGATGYRVEYQGKSACYVTDTEHKPGCLDENILNLAKDADVLIYDSTYTDEEYQNFVGWGHSTWQQGLRISEAANVKKFVAFHHDPSHNDDFMDRIAADIESRKAGSLVAKEGMIIDL